VKTRAKPELPKPKKGFFQLVILPSDAQIRYLEPETDIESFVDCFGIRGSGVASKATQTAKFMSYDDRAFTINSRQGQEFYGNLGISKESLDRLSLPAASVLNISGLSWIFTDLSHPDVDFKNTRRGIYSQLFYRNYRKKAR
jgi:hypothetical protein